MGESGKTYPKITNNNSKECTFNFHCFLTFVLMSTDYLKYFQLCLILMYDKCLILLFILLYNNFLKAIKCIYFRVSNISHKLKLLKLKKIKFSIQIIIIQKANGSIAWLEDKLYIWEQAQRLQQHWCISHCFPQRRNCHSKPLESK